MTKIIIHHKIDVDDCLVDEILKLNNHNILTLACCCGHGKIENAFIAVNDNYDDGDDKLSSVLKMWRLGYIPTEKLNYMASTMDNKSPYVRDRHKTISCFVPKSKCVCQLRKD